MKGTMRKTRRREPEGRSRTNSKFTMLVTEEERDMLAALAADRGESCSVYIRRIVRENYAAVASRVHVPRAT
jgi:hypothetical protein